MQKDRMTTSVIVSTTNYERFKLVGTNRIIKQKNVARLMKSFKMTGGMQMSKPIIVNSDMQVIDGQHRLEACKRMGIPVHYVVSNDKIENIPIYNTYQEKWGMEDYARYWAENGKDSYKRILQIRDKVSTGLNGILECLMPRGGTNNEAFKEGNFVFEQDVDECAEYVSKIMHLCYLIKGKRNISVKVVRAVRFLSKIKAFKLDNLIDKIQRYQGKLYSCATSEEYIQMFVELYNYKIQLNRISSTDILAAKNI